jgi:hypothetical protein
MKISPQVRALLPLRCADHRYIASTDDATVAEIYSGSIGISAANELEMLIVTAVNAHEALVAALATMVAANATGEEVSLDEFRAATEALALAAKP